MSLSSYGPTAGSDPPFAWKLVTPSDSADLSPSPCRGLACKTAGVVSFIDAKGNTVASFPVVAGQILPGFITRVKATTTTATVYALY